MERIFTFIKAKKYIFIASIIYIVTCVILGFIKYKMFKGILETGVIYYIIIPPASLFMRFLYGDEAENKETQKKRWVSKLFTILLEIICIAVIIYFIYTNIYNLYLYQMLVIIFIPVIPGRLGRWLKKGNQTSKTHIVLYSAILITTCLYCLIANPYTVDKAERVLTEDGYTNISYAMNVNDKITIDIAFKNIMTELSSNEDKLGFYLFKAEANGEYYGFLISVVSGRIVAVGSEEDNNIIS